MANLAIKGHATRGKEVIELLEMLGGKNNKKYNGNLLNWIYFINVYGYIEMSNSLQHIDYEQFTLEEFLEKFPYKVGDKVSSKYLKNYEISKMEWGSVNNRVIYKLQGMGWYSAKELQPYKEETMEERENSVVVNIEHKQLKIHSLRFDKTQLMINDEYELKQEGDAYYIVRKKPQYPKTYEECCDVLGTHPIYNNPNLCICEWHPETREMHEHYSKLANLSQKDIAFMKLLICRDAYWKIAGEEMGLDEPWEPDYDSGVNKFGIICLNGIIQESNPTTNWERHLNKVLDFPTAEMRDAYKENFDKDIEFCKEFL